MRDKPDDVPQWAWDKSFDLVRTWYAEEWESPPSYIKVILIKDVAYAILQARSQAFEEAAKIADCGCNNPGCERDEIAQAIRQHSQKGEDNADDN